MRLYIHSECHGQQIVFIDKEDYPKIKDKSLWLSKSGQFLYVRLSSGKYLHRFLVNAPKNMVVDHINRNTLDNRKKNLKICTIQENLRNQKRPSNKTGVTGVALYKYGYTAQIKVDYKKIHLGCFKTVKEAAKTRKEAEKKYWNI